MRRRGAVQRKVPCLFVTEVKEEPSAKRERQAFQVLATATITGKALEADIYNAIPTEKVAGTCCCVTAYKGYGDLRKLLVLPLWKPQGEPIYGPGWMENPTNKLKEEGVNDSRVSGLIFKCC